MVERNNTTNLSLKLGDVVPKPPAPRSETEIMSTWVGDLDTPLLSILCITFNHAPFIEDALNSFLMQETTFPFEVIVHDDASTDGNQSIIKNYQKRYPRIIRAIYQEENQYSKGRRALSFFQGMSNARYLAVCEGDDYWLDPFKLQIQVDFLECNKDFVITGHDAIVIDELGQLIKPSKLPVFFQRDYSGYELSRDKAWILTMSWVYRNVIPNFAPERNMVRNGDNFLVSLLGEYGKSHYHHDINSAVYRVHPGGVWSMIDQADKADDALNTRFWMYRYYKRIGRKELENYFKVQYQRRALRETLIKEIFREAIRRIFKTFRLIPFMKTLHSYKISTHLKRLVKKINRS